jgi:hypothetical protein
MSSNNPYTSSSGFNSTSDGSSFSYEINLKVSSYTSSNSSSGYDSTPSGSCSSYELNLKMFSNNPSSSSSSSGLNSTPSGSGPAYQITSSGTNRDGNHYCSRDYGSDAPNARSYHYSNAQVQYLHLRDIGSNANVMATVTAHTTTATPMARLTTTRVMDSPSTLLLRASETRHAIYHHCGVYPQLRQTTPHCGREVADMM